VPFIYLLAAFALVMLAGPLVAAIEAPIAAAGLIGEVDDSDKARFRSFRRVLYPLAALCYVAFLVLTWKHVRFAVWLFIGPVVLAPCVFLVFASPRRRPTSSQP